MIALSRKRNTSRRRTTAYVAYGYMESPTAYQVSQELREQDVDKHSTAYN